MMLSSIWGGALADLYPKRSILVMGVWSLVFGAMIPLGSLEAGAVAHFLGTPWALAFGAIICAASALVTLFVVRRREAQIAR